jgi:hypothetical protein
VSNKSRTFCFCFRSQGRGNKFFSKIPILAFEARADSCSFGYQGSFPRVNRPGRDVDQPPLSVAEVTNKWSYTSSPPVRLHSVDSGTFSYLYSEVSTLSDTVYCVCAEQVCFSVRSSSFPTACSPFFQQFY